jgi:hypothetical protein
MNQLANTDVIVFFIRKSATPAPMYGSPAIVMDA